MVLKSHFSKRIALFLIVALVLCFIPFGQIHTTSYAAATGYWKLVTTPEAKVVNYPNGAAGAKLEFSGSQMVYTASYLGNITDAKTYKLSTLLPERLNAGDNLEVTVEATSLSGTNGGLAITGPTNESIYVGTSALKTTKAVKINGGDLNKDNGVGHYLIFKLFVADANTAAGQPDTPPPYWAYEWTAEEAAATGESAETLESLTITPNTLQIGVNKPAALKASAKYSLSEPEEVTDHVQWSTSNAKIASVNEEGVVTGLTAGSTTITAKLEDKTTTIQVTVTAGQTVTKLVPKRATLYLKVGQQGNNTITAYLGATTKQDVTKLATYQPQDPKAIVVGKNGYFKAMKKGTYKMTVTYKGASTSFSIVVK